MNVIRTGLVLFTSLALSSITAAQATWTGGASSNWHTAANWSTGVVPGAGTNVTIGAAGIPPSTYVLDPVCNDLTVASGATLTLGGGFDLTVGGNLQIDGTLAVTAGTSDVNVAGNWTNDGTFTNGGGSVDLTGTGTLGGTSSTTFQNLSVSGGVRTTSTAFVADGDVSVTGGAEFAIGTMTHQVGGNWTSSGIGATVSGTGTIEFTGNGLLTTSFNALPNVLVSGGSRSVNTSEISGDLTMTGGSLTILDNVTLTVDGDANLTGGILGFSGGFAGDEVIDIAGNATLTCAAGTFTAESIIECGGNWSSSSSFDPAEGRVQLDGAGLRTLSGASPMLFDLRVTTGTVNSTSALDIDGDLTINSGTTFDADQVLDIEGNVTLGDGTAIFDIGAATHTVAGNWTSFGGSTSGLGTIQFDGTGTVSTGGGSMHNVLVTAGTRTASTTALNGNLTMTGGGLVVSDNQSITVAGDANLTAGTLAFSDTSAGSETLDVEGDCTITANAGATSVNSTINCAGTWTSTSAFSPANGQVRLDGASTMNIMGTGPVFSNLRIVNGQKTLMVPATVNGNLRVDDSASLITNGAVSVSGFVSLGNSIASWDLGGLTHTVGGDWLSTGASATNGTIDLDGAGGTVSTGGGTIENLTITSGTHDVDSSTVTGDLVMTGGITTIQASETLTVNGSASITGGTLALEASSLLDVGTDVDVSGASAGTVDATSRIEYGGDWTSSGTFVPANGTVEADGGAGTTIGGTAAHFANLELTGGAATVNVPTTTSGDLTSSVSITSTAAMTVAGDLSLGDGTTSWALGGLSHTITGSYTSAGADATGGTLVFDGGGNFSPAGASVPNVQSTGGTRLAFNGTITGNLDVTGGVFRIDNDQTVVVQGDANLTGGQISWFPTALGALDEVLDVEGNVTCTVPIEFQTADSVLRCAGNWSSDATFAPTAVTVELDGGVATTVSGAAPTFFDLTIANATRQVLSATTISGNLVVNSGAALDADAAIDVGGNVTLGDATASWDLGALTHTVGGNYLSFGADAVGTGTVEFDGNGSTSTGAGTLPNMLVSAGVRGVLTSTVSGDLSVTGGDLEVLDNQTLTVGGDANLTGGLLGFVGTTPGTELLDVAGNVTLTAADNGTTATSRIECAGNWTADGTWTPVAGTVALDPAVSSIVSGSAPLTFFDLELNSGSIDIQTDTAIDGNLDVASGVLASTSALLDIEGDVVLNATSSLDIGTLGHFVKGDWTSTGATVTGTGSLVFDGGGTTTTGTDTIPNMGVIAGGRTVADTVVAGVVTMTGGAIAIADNSTLSVGGDANLTGGQLTFIDTTAGTELLDVEGNMTLTATSNTTTANSRIECAGNWTSSGAWVPSAGTVSLDPAVLCTVSGTGTLQFANLELATAAVDIGTPTVISADLTVADGVALTTTAALDVNGSVALGDATSSWDIGSVTHTVRLNYSSTGGSATGAGIIAFDGNGTTGTGTGTLPHIVISGIRGFANSQVLGDVDMATGILAIQDDQELSVSGDLNLTGGSLSFVGGAPGAEVLDVEGNVICNVSAGTTSPEARVECAGNWTSGSGYSPTNGTFAFDGAGGTTVSGIGLTLADVEIGATPGTVTISSAASVDSLTVNSGSALITTGAQTIAGAVSLGDGTASWDLGGLTHTVAGDWTSAGASASNGTADLGGDGLLSTSTGSIANVVSSSGTRTAQSTNVLGNLDVTGGTFLIDNDATVAVGGDATMIGGMLSWHATADATDEVLDVEGNGVFLLPIGTISTSSVLRCGGDFQSDGTFAMNSGTLELDGVGTTNWSSAGVFDPIFNGVIVVNGTRQLTTDLDMTVTALTIEAGAGVTIPNGTTLTLPAAVVIVDGVLDVQDAGTLALGPGSFVSASSTGTLRVVGSGSDPAVVTGDAGGGYLVNVVGTVEASNFRFEQMGVSGVIIDQNATIGAFPNDLRGGVFSDPSASPGSVMLDIERLAPTTLSYVDFVDDGGVGTFNVKSLDPGGSTITLVNSTGNFSGDAFDQDPFGLIDWVSAPTVVDSFSASGGPDVVNLDWTVSAEIDTQSWVLERGTDALGPFSQIAEIPASGGPYNHPDLTVVPQQKYFYNLVEKKTHGATSVIASASTIPWSSGLPSSFLTVGTTGTFADLQSAIDAASGLRPVVYVETGTYAPFTVGAGSGVLRIIADGSGPVIIDTTTGPARVENLTALDSLEISDLEFGDGTGGNPGLQVDSCAGVVIIDECVINGGGATIPGLQLTSSTRVAVQRCTITGDPGVIAEAGTVAIAGRGSIDEINLSGGSNVRLAELTPVPTVAAGSTLTTLPGTHADVDTPEFPVLGSTMNYSVSGEPGEFFSLHYSLNIAWFDLPGPPWEMVGLLNINQAPNLTSGLLGPGPNPQSTPIPAVGNLFGFPVALQMVVVDPINFDFRWSNVTSIIPVN